MGSYGLEQVGRTIIYNIHYTKRLLNQLPGVRTDRVMAAPFKEIVVDFNATGKTVAEINKALLQYDIFGGKDLSKEFPHLGESALYCVTEVHSKVDLDELESALKEILS
jgi:glycine dehydrogenase subunit 1